LKLLFSTKHAGLHFDFSAVYSASCPSIELCYQY